jgi:proteic killer suppression protein
MIIGFADKDTEDLFAGKRVRAFQAFADAAQRRLEALAAAGTLRDLQARPGNRFERLKGDRAGRFSIRINGQWRVCFAWQFRHPVPSGLDPLDAPGDADLVEIVDYY